MARAGRGGARVELPEPCFSHGGAQGSLAGEGGLEEWSARRGLLEGGPWGRGRTWGWVEGVCSGGPEGPGGEGEAAVILWLPAPVSLGRGSQRCSSIPTISSVVPLLGHSGVGPIRPRPRLGVWRAPKFPGHAL